jgi:hypothetical protein
MLSDQDKSWLASEYPGLIVRDGELTGRIAFTAAYNDLTQKFLRLNPNTIDNVGGLSLDCEYEITIKPRSTTVYSRLPALSIANVQIIPDRHLNVSDNSACLCSPLLEEEFLLPEFNFRLYMEELVVPFLYGQAFYDLNEHWPFPDYAHGVVGLLESYTASWDNNKIKECVRICALDKGSWPRVRGTLVSNGIIKGHTLCPCPKRDHIRRCHPKALLGLRLLQGDIKRTGLSLPNVLPTASSSANSKQILR